MAEEHNRLHEKANNAYMEWWESVIAKERAQFQAQLDAIGKEIAAGNISADRRQDLFEDLTSIASQATSAVIRDQAREHMNALLKSLR